jgi:hypothetical protein
MFGAYSLPWAVWLLLIVAFWSLQLMVCAFSEIKEITAPDRKNRALYRVARATMIVALCLSVLSCTVRTFNWAGHRQAPALTATSR